MSYRESVFIKNRFFRFIVVGIINTLFGVGVYSLLLYWGISYVWAIFIGTVIGVLFNFKTTGRLVFGCRENRFLFKFIISYVIGYVVNLLIVRFLIMYIGFNSYWSGYIAIPIVAILSFFLQRYWVFKKRK